MYIKNKPGTPLEYPFNPRSLRDSGDILPREMTDEFLATRDVFPVTPVDPPEASSIYTVTEGIPEEVSPGVWQQTWVSTPLPLVDAKTALRDRVNAIKNHYQQSGAPTPHGIVDSDMDSRNKLNGAVLMAMLAAQAGQPFALTWTLADNSNVNLDGQSLITMASAVGQYVATCHGHAQVLKAAIDAAADHAALDAIDIEAGWP